MELQSYDVVVIQHYDRLTSGKFAHSTTVGVGATIDRTVKGFIVLLDEEMPLYETIDAWTIPQREDYQKLRELFKKEVLEEFPNKSPEEDVLEEFPNKSPEEIERIAEELTSIVHGTKRKVVHSFQWPEWTYKQIITRWNYWD
jgi:hypothetical protein